MDQIAVKLILLRRYPISEDDEKEAADWLQKRYLQKDELFDTFLRTCEFLTKQQQALPEYQNFKYMELSRRPFSLMNFCFWALVILVPLLWLLFSVFTSENYLRLGISLVLIVAVHMGLLKLIRPATTGRSRWFTVPP